MQQNEVKEQNTENKPVERFPNGV